MQSAKLRSEAMVVVTVVDESVVEVFHVDQVQLLDAAMEETRIASGSSS